MLYMFLFTFGDLPNSLVLEFRHKTGRGFTMVQVLSWFTMLQPRFYHGHGCTMVELR